MGDRKKPSDEYQDFPCSEGTFKNGFYGSVAHIDILLLETKFLGVAVPLKGN